MSDITREQLIEAMKKEISIRQCQDNECCLNEKGGCLCEMDAIAALTAIEALGLKVAPYEPTDAMIRNTYASSSHRHIDDHEKRDIYKWMLSAFPSL
jgi:hypothetical protein